MRRSLLVWIALSLTVGGCHKNSDVNSAPVAADFLDKLSLFVPVYLDGDAPDAQRWADEFKIVVARLERQGPARCRHSSGARPSRRHLRQASGR
jgi:hypothetical protein